MVPPVLCVRVFRDGCGLGGLRLSGLRLSAFGLSTLSEGSRADR